MRIPGRRWQWQICFWSRTQDCRSPVGCSCSRVQGSSPWLAVQLGRLQRCPGSLHYQRWRSIVLSRSRDYCFPRCACRRNCFQSLRCTCLVVWEPAFRSGKGGAGRSQAGLQDLLLKTCLWDCHVDDRFKILRSFLERHENCNLEKTKLVQWQYSKLKFLCSQTTLAKGWEFNSIISFWVIHEVSIWNLKYYEKCLPC